MRYILLDLECSLHKCDNCRFLKYGRCLLFKNEKPYGEDRSNQCIKSDMTDYIQEVVTYTQEENNENNPS